MVLLCFYIINVISEDGYKVQIFRIIYGHIIGTVPFLVLVSLYNIKNTILCSFYVGAKLGL